MGALFTTVPVLGIVGLVGLGKPFFNPAFACCRVRVRVRVTLTVTVRVSRVSITVSVRDSVK